MCERYEGWVNRETWCAALWIDNDELLYYEARRIAADPGTTGRSLEMWFEEICEPVEVVDPQEWGTPGEGNRLVSFAPEVWTMISDIGSMYRIDWTEIHDHLLTK